MATTVPSASITTASTTYSDLPFCVASASIRAMSSSLSSACARTSDFAGAVLDRHVLDQGIELALVECDEGENPAEHLGDGEQHAGVHDAKVVAVARDWGRGGREPAADFDDSPRPWADGMVVANIEFMNSSWAASALFVTSPDYPPRLVRLLNWRTCGAPSGLEPGACGFTDAVRSRNRPLRRRSFENTFRVALYSYS